MAKTPAPKNFDKPAHLSRVGSKAHRVIMDFLREHDMLDSGGSKVFYSPKEWKDRGEEYGLTSVLIVTYDGGKHRDAFTLDNTYELYEALSAKLREADLWMEACTCWYAAVYEK